MNKGKIYCVHCIITGKKYIGQTIKENLNLRINEHISDSSKYNHKFANAIKKYGKDNFIWGTIEEYDVSLLNVMEIYWINRYDTFNNGYNTTTGGNQRKEYCIKEYIIENSNGERQIIKNLSEYCRNNKLNIGHIHETLYGKRLHHKGYKLIPKTEQEIQKYNQERIKRYTNKRGVSGEQNGRSKLNWDKVNKIRKMHLSKTYKNQEIADLFGVKRVTIEKIISNKTWTV